MIAQDQCICFRDHHHHHQHFPFPFHNNNNNNNNDNNNSSSSNYNSRAMSRPATTPPHHTHLHRIDNEMKIQISADVAQNQGNWNQTELRLFEIVDDASRRRQTQTKWGRAVELQQTVMEPGHFQLVRGHSNGTIRGRRQTAVIAVGNDGQRRSRRDR